MSNPLRIMQRVLAHGVPARAGKKNPMQRAIESLAHTPAGDKRTMSSGARTRMRKESFGRARSASKSAKIPQERGESEKEIKMAKGDTKRARGYAKGGGTTADELADLHEQMGEEEGAKRAAGIDDPNYAFEGTDQPTARDIQYMEKHGGDAAYDAYVEQFGKGALKYLRGLDNSQESANPDVPMPRERPQWGDQESYSGTEYNYPGYEQYGGKLPKGFDTLMQAFADKMGRPPRDYKEFVKYFGDAGIMNAQERAGMQDGFSPEEEMRMLDKDQMVGPGSAPYEKLLRDAQEEPQSREEVLQELLKSMPELLR